MYKDIAKSIFKIAKDKFLEEWFNLQK
jgi:hypothetical protein